MKKAIFGLPLRLLGAAALLLALGGCSKKKSDDPQPQPEHRLTVRYSATNVAGLGARITIKDQRAYGAVNPYASEAPTGTAAKTWEMGPYDIGGSVEVDLYFDNVTPAGTLRVPAGSEIKTEILVDGVVTASAKLDPTTPVTSRTGLHVSTAVEIDNL